MMGSKSPSRDSSEYTKSKGGSRKKSQPSSSSVPQQIASKSLEMDSKTSRRNQIAKSVQPKKTLVRNCNSKAEAVSVVKSCEANSQHMPPKIEAAVTKPSERGSLHAPSQVTTLKTIKEIRRVSELDLVEAYKCVHELSLTDTNIDRKVARAALNVPSDTHVYSDLVSVDVADHQLGPRITEIRKHHSRDRRDHDPQLSDFFRPDCREVNDIWPSFPPISIPFDPVVMYDGKTVARSIYKWHQRGEEALKFLASE